MAKFVRGITRRRFSGLLQSLWLMVTLSPLRLAAQDCSDPGCSDCPETPIDCGAYTCYPDIFIGCLQEYIESHNVESGCGGNCHYVAIEWSVWCNCAQFAETAYPCCSQFV